MASGNAPPPAESDDAKGGGVRVESVDGVAYVYRRVNVKFANGDEYRGDTRDGKRHGRGVFTYAATGDTYVGCFENDLFGGFGVMQRRPFLQGGTVHVGWKYEGTWKDGMRHGAGMQNDGAGELYDGNWVEDRPHGTGTAIYSRITSGGLSLSVNRTGTASPAVKLPDAGLLAIDALTRQTGEGAAASVFPRDSSALQRVTAPAEASGGPRDIDPPAAPRGPGEYIGEWVAGRQHGKGTRRWTNGDVYDGFFERGLFHGEGTFKFAGGGSYSGGWAGGLRSGIGRRVYAGGAVVEGEWVKGALSGRGVYRSALGNELFVGEWSEGVPHGEGVLQRASGEAYQGQWDRGVPCGAGRVVYRGGGWYTGAFAAQVRTGLSWTRSEDSGSTKSRAAEAKARRKRAAAAAGGLPLPGLSIAARSRASRRVVVGSSADAAWLARGELEGTSVAPARDGKRHGHGVRVWGSGARYEGEFCSGLPHGFGVYIGPPSAVSSSSASGCDERFEGTFKEGERVRGVASYGDSAAGTATPVTHTADARALTYVCAFGNRHPATAGRCFYDGEFQRGTFNGTGTFTCLDGRQYTGSWMNGKPHGRGRWVMLPLALHADCCESSAVTDASARVTFSSTTSSSGGSSSSGASSAAAATGQPYGVLSKVGLGSMSAPRGPSRSGGEMDDDESPSGAQQRAQQSAAVLRSRPHRHSLDDVSRTRLYEGEFRCGQRTGDGRVVLNNGDVLEGRFVDGRLQGLVRVTFRLSGRVVFAHYDAHGDRTRWADAAENAALLARDKAAAELKSIISDATARNPLLAITDPLVKEGGVCGEGQGEAAAVPLLGQAASNRAAAAAALQRTLRRRRHSKERSMALVKARRRASVVNAAAAAATASAHALCISQI